MYPKHQKATALFRDGHMLLNSPKRASTAWAFSPLLLLPELEVPPCHAKYAFSQIIGSTLACCLSDVPVI